MPGLSPAQLRVARHALGLPNANKTSCRNDAPHIAGSLHAFVFDEIVQIGLAKREALGSERLRYSLTREGAERALEPGERLDATEFPPPDLPHPSTLF